MTSRSDATGLRVLQFQQRRADVRWRVELAKGQRRRLYEIRPAGVDGMAQTWVRFDGRPHRAKLTSSVTELAQIRQEYEREVAALLEDGWVRC